MSAWGPIESSRGATRIFLNTKGTRDDVDDSVRAFLNYVNGVVREDSLVQEIDEEIHRIKEALINSALPS